MIPVFILTTYFNSVSVFSSITFAIRFLKRYIMSLPPLPLLSSTNNMAMVKKNRHWTWKESLINNDVIWIWMTPVHHWKYEKMVPNHSVGRTWQDEDITDIWNADVKWAQITAAPSNWKLQYVSSHWIKIQWGLRSLQNYPRSKLWEFFTSQITNLTDLHEKRNSEEVSY